MPSDPAKPLLKVESVDAGERSKGQPNRQPRPEPFARARQLRQFGPKFRRLAEVLRRDPSGAELTTDPSALAPERLLVFEVRGPIGRFIEATKKVAGLEFVDEEELVAVDNENPVAYLLLPDARALNEIESLWRRWRRGRPLGRGFTPWRDVFALLRDVRPWGPADRVSSRDRQFLAEEVDGHPDADLIELELELVYSASQQRNQRHEAEVVAAVEAARGQTLSRCEIDEIAYHALLARVPARQVRAIVERSRDSLAGLSAIMHIRPQSLATSIEVLEASEDVRQRAIAEPSPDPILAVLDGVPVAGHALLRRHLIVDDVFRLEPSTPVAARVHGTAMASLIVHGDKDRAEPPIGRKIHVIPVLGGPNENFPQRRLIVDVIYQSVIGMRTGQAPSAPNVLIVNVSLGNSRNRFHGQMSPWGRLLDRLAYRFGILFVVSGGNIPDEIEVHAFRHFRDLEDAAADQRAVAILRTLGSRMVERRLLSPAESMNAVTVGARNEDAVANRVVTTSVDPYSPPLVMANPSSALGPGYAGSVKPDMLMPGAREHLTMVASGGAHVSVRPSGPARAHGLKVASPPAGAIVDAVAYTNGTSAAAALASRTAHRIYEALELEYADQFTGLGSLQKAVVLKALLLHPAQWPPEAAELIRSVLGPADPHKHSQQRDNIRRFLGYGCVDSEDAVACASDRATFWAVGSLDRERAAKVSVPVPVSFGGEARAHKVIATLAWFTPVTPGRRGYRAVRLSLREPQEVATLRVDAEKNQPDVHQSRRGTVISRTWTGDRAAVVNANTNLELVVQREIDAGTAIDESVPFALAATIAMPGELRIYDQVRQRLAAAIRPRGRAH